MRPSVLVACEYSGIVRDAFLRKGIFAVSCDIIDGEPPSPFHIKSDVLPLLEQEWTLVIAHPPCTYLTNSGVHHLGKQEGRWEKMFEGAAFFQQFQTRLNHVPFVAIENPIPHKYARQHIGKYSQIIQPWQFGHPERKAICLWLKNLPPLTETKNVKEEMLQLPKAQQNRIHYMSPGVDRGKLRSRFYEGIAAAMADQWSPLLWQHTSTTESQHSSRLFMASR